MTPRSTQFPPISAPLHRPMAQVAHSQSPKGVIIELGSAVSADGFDSGSARTDAYDRCLRGEGPRWPIGA